MNDDIDNLRVCTMLQNRLNYVLYRESNNLPSVYGKILTKELFGMYFDKFVSNLSVKQICNKYGRSCIRYANDILGGVVYKGEYRFFTDKITYIIELKSGETVRLKLNNEYTINGITYIFKGFMHNLYYPPKVSNINILYIKSGLLYGRIYNIE